MRKHGARTGGARASGWRRSVCVFSVLLFEKPLAPNAALEKLETVNYLNKTPSQIHLFKNKFAIARNKRNMRRFCKRLTFSVFLKTAFFLLFRGPRFGA